MTLKELRRNAHNRLKEQPNISSPELDADLIIMFVLDLKKDELLTKDISVPDALAIEVNAYLNRRLAGMPVQYIVGKTEFMSLDFIVNKNVLIPRQDTEILVETVIERYKNVSEQIRILDIGSGSGCVGISMARYLPNSVVTELDISEEALKGGMTAFEVGIGQAGDVADLMFKAGYRNIEIIPDLGGIERVVLGYAA